MPVRPAQLHSREAIAEKAEQVERRAEFDAVAEARYARIVDSGKTIRVGARCATTLRGVAGTAGEMPAARKLAK